MGALLIGVFAGLRSLTPPAVVAWAAHVGRLQLPGSLAWVGSTPAVAIFGLLALLELVADKLPSTPARTAPPPLIARCVTGAFTGSCIAAAGAGSAVVGALLGLVGALVGTFGGYQARMRLTQAIDLPLAAAVIEDVVTIVGALWVVSR